MKLRQSVKLALIWILPLLMASPLVKSASAQKQPDTIDWHPNWGSVMLGQGVEITLPTAGTPSHLATRNKATVTQNLKPEDITFEVTKYDVSQYDQEASGGFQFQFSTWGEADSLVASGKWSFSAQHFHYNRTNTRRWEVIAFRRVTLSGRNFTYLPNLGNLTNDQFRSYYGNYYVKSISYIKKVVARFTSYLSHSITEDALKIATEASADFVLASAKGGANADACKKALDSIGSTEIEVYTEGQGIDLGPVITTGDLPSVGKAITGATSTWATIPDKINPEDPKLGNVDRINVLNYKTITGGPTFDDVTIPDVSKLGIALRRLLNLQYARWRVSQLLDPGRTLRPITQAYLLKTDIHLQNDIRIQEQIVDALRNQKPVTLPDIKLSYFKDPENVSWELLATDFPRDYIRMLFRIVGDMDVVALHSSGTEPERYDALKNARFVGGNLTWDGGLTKVDSFRERFEPETGVPVRYVSVWYKKDRVPHNLRMGLFLQNQNLDARELAPYARATDASGQYQPYIDLSW